MENEVHCTKYIQQLLLFFFFSEMKKQEQKISSSQNGSRSRFLKAKGPV